MKDDPMIALRKAFRDILMERFNFDIESGVYDSVLNKFINGEIELDDTITIQFSIETIPNDIIVFRSLAGFLRDQSIIDRIKDYWKR